MTWLLLGVMAAAVGYGVMTWREFTAFSEDILPRIERLDKEAENLGKIIKSETHSVQEAQELVDMESRLEMKMYKSEFKANKNR